MDCYTFDAVAGDTMRLRHAKTGGNLTPIFLLSDPDGGSLPECTQSAAELNCSLGATGSYTVLVLDSPSSGGGSGTYAIALQRPNNPGNCTSLSFGAAPVAASIGQPAEMDCFRLSGAPADRIQMAVAVATGATLSRDVDVFAPEGGLICSAPSAPCFLENAGMHTILVDDSNGAGTGGYGIAVQRLNNPPGASCTALAFGAAPTNASIALPGEMDCYSFSGSLGAQVRIRLVTTSGQLLASSEIVQTDGTLVCQPGTALDFTCGTDADGQHRIIVSDDAFGPDTGNYSIAIQRLSAPNNCVALTYGGAPVSASISGAAEMDCYTFTGAAGDRVRLHVLGRPRRPSRGDRPPERNRPPARVSTARSAAPS